MAKKTFTYGGYTFEPRGQFKDYGIKSGKNEMRDVCRALHYFNAGCVADGDEKFNYDDFYEAAGQCEDDVFFCKETNELYVPCAAVLCIFDRESTDDEVGGRYNKRIAQREEHEEFVKREALKNAMCLTDEQRKAINALREAAYKCCEVGLNFAANGGDMYVFRADTLKDITDDMAPMEGQVQIESGMYLAIENAWDACEGLYANPKDINN